MADEKFVEFARHRLRFGTPTQDVAATLRINGLSEAEIQEVLSAAHNSSQTPTSTLAPESASVSPPPPASPAAPPALEPLSETLSSPPSLPDPVQSSESTAVPVPTPAPIAPPVTVMPQMSGIQTPRAETVPPVPLAAAMPQPAVSVPAPASVGAVAIEPEVPAAMIYAGFWRRTIAAVIDGVILTFLYSGIAIGVSFAMKVDASSYAQFVQGPGLIISLIASLVGLLYNPLLETSKLQGSLGKHFLGLIVTDTNGMRISFLRALMRNLAKVTSAVIFMIGFLMVAFTKQKQGLHDMIAGCLVLRQEHHSS